eukprot:IDg9633t1
MSMICVKLMQTYLRKAIKRLLNINNVVLSTPTLQAEQQRCPIGQMYYSEYMSEKLPSKIVENLESCRLSRAVIFVTNDVPLERRLESFVSYNGELEPLVSIM